MHKLVWWATALGLFCASYEIMAFSISCPSQDDFSRFSQERMGPEQVRFSFFQARPLAWSTLSLVVNVPLPYNQSARPQLENTAMNLSYDDEQHEWTISCTYREVSGFGIADRDPSTSVTITRREAARCTLNDAAKLVVCTKAQRVQ